MDENIERRVFLKIYAANKISCAESLNMLQKVYDESNLSKPRSYGRYKVLKEGREVTKVFSRPGHPSTASSDKVKQMTMENRHTSLKEVTQDLLRIHSYSFR